jgi:hypothetical protein
MRVCYIYRRHLELNNEKEAWAGEKKYFSGLVDKLDPRREHLGRSTSGSCVDFYKAARHDAWTL